MLTPMSDAPAAPANAPCGIAWAAKDGPAQHGEEADDAGDDGDHRRRDPGVDAVRLRTSGELASVTAPVRAAADVRDESRR